jgi:diguanylate cyclase (GGDEF)-like protein
MAASSAKLAALNERVQGMRAVLVRLLQDVVRAETRLDNHQATQLLEANEQLVVTALNAQQDADTATQELDEASRSAGLDPLTGLANRVALLDRLAQAIAQAKRRGTQVGLLFLDLNHFKQINDAFGHAAGDEALKLAASLLQSAVRETDTVSRHGGDEFLILLAEMSRAADAVVVAEKVLAALAEGSCACVHAILTASIGVSIYPDDGEEARTLVEHADAAMYLAKRYEAGGYVVHGGHAPSQPWMHEPTSGPKPPPAPRAIAEHERRNAQLREANERLVLAALTAQELQTAAEDAQRRQTAFLAGVAHELSNPRSPIRIATAMLGRMRTEEPLLPRAQAIIERQVARMARMVSGLIGVGQAAPGLPASEPQTFDVVRIIRDAVDALRPALHRRGQSLDLDVPAEPVLVRGHPVQLAQAFANLLGNATRYTQEAGAIRVAYGVDDDTVAVSVADNGMGISAETLPRVFDTFYQANHTLGLDGIGLGLGLTVVRSIVEAHGGSVAASSPGSGLGSRFVITLPRARQPQ